MICAAGDGLAPGRQEALRAARRHRHGRGDPADRVSSIMSKKIAEGTGALVLDVKVGTGAFMKDARPTPASWPRRWSRSARTPACTPSPCSPTCPRRSGSPPATRSRCAESVEVLAGGGPADVVELTLALAREMLAAAGRRRRRPGRQAGRRLGHGRLAAMIRAQGGDPDADAAGGEGDARRRPRPPSGVLDPARRDGGRPRRLAARRRPGPQGGPGAGRRRRGAGTPRPGDQVTEGAAAVHPAHRRARTASTARWPRSRAATTSG